MESENREYCKIHKCGGGEVKECKTSWCKKIVRGHVNKAYCSPKCRQRHNNTKTPERLSRTIEFFSKMERSNKQDAELDNLIKFRESLKRESLSGLLDEKLNHPFKDAMEHKK